MLTLTLVAKFSKRCSYQNQGAFYKLFFSKCLYVSIIELYYYNKRLAYLVLSLS